MTGLTSERPSRVDKKSYSSVEILESFERRAKRLQRTANIFIFAAFLLLFAGAFAVVYAPSLTQSDIAKTLPIRDRVTESADRVAQRRLELRDANQKRQQMKEVCVTALRRFFNGPNSSSELEGMVDDVPLVPHLDGLMLPTSEAVASAVGEIKSPLGPSLRLQFRFRVCNDVTFNRRVDLRQVNAFIKALETNLFVDFSVVALNEMSVRIEDLQQALLDAEGELKRGRQAEFDLALEQSKSKTEDSGTLLARLAQTSVTRFGLLAVIGFFVSLLVSLYRYNVRLAAFYLARADVLKISARKMTTGEFGAMASALSPSVEFGKTPQPPIVQLVELLKATKETGK